MGLNVDILCKYLLNLFCVVLLRFSKCKCTGTEVLTEISNRLCKRSLKLPTASFTTVIKPSAPSAPHRPG